MSKYDFHLHSNYSDGYWNIDEILYSAQTHGFEGIVLTDHDNVLGQEEFVKKASKLGMQTTTGVEITTTIASQRLDILGYGIDITNPKLISELTSNREAKNRRDERLINYLRGKGFFLDQARIEEIRANSRGYLGRVKIANLVLEKEENIRFIKIPTFNGLWEEYLDSFSSVDQISSIEAIELIHQAGGNASLAHPGDDMPELEHFENITHKLVENGLDGIEVYSWKHNEEQSHYYKEYAEKHNLLVTFGSDDHGWPKVERTMSKVIVPNEEVLAQKFFSKVN